jgi:hypothetical protein
VTGSRPLGIDPGALTLKIASGQEVAQFPSPAGGPVAILRSALSQAQPGAEICVAVPDAWLSGGTADVLRLEEMREECVKVGARAPTWAGQLAAASAFAAADRGAGRYLVADLGGTGIRAGLFSVSDGSVQIEAVHAEAGGGWRDFDAAVRAALPSGQSSELPATWYEQASSAEKAARAVMVLDEALSGDDDALDTRVYRIAGPNGDIAITGRAVIDSFAPAERSLETAIAAVRAVGSPEHLVLTGGFSWLPLAARRAASAVGAEPLTLGPDAAARGALLFAGKEAALAPPAGREPVTIPVHRFRDGLLEGDDVRLPWNEPFAVFPAGALTVGSDELQVSFGGRPMIARLPGLAPGPHQIGLRAAWPGPGVLVVRPAAGGGAAHVVPLTDLVAR